MAFPHTSNTPGLHLVLGLAPTATNTDSTNKPAKSSCSFTPTATSTSCEPSLTLALSSDTNYQHVPEKVHVKKPCEDTTLDFSRHTSPHSAVSSFSSGGGGRVKRERDVSCEEVEAADRVSSRGSDEDEDGTNARKKLRLTKEQSKLLEESFKLNSTLNPKQKQALAGELNLRPRQVEVWFQNRRARTKLKQTEVDCELLKKCCETLTDENRRLQREVQELKALKVAQPLYMAMPAATLTMCPSCERMGGVAGDGVSNKKTSFSMAPKSHHFYTPFPNPSAAC